MRQTDIIDGIREIVVNANIDASPENYEICYRFVTRSDSQVCASFEGAMAVSMPIDAEAFGKIRDAAGPPRGQIDAGGYITQLDQQLARITGAAADALGHTASYSKSLDAGAAGLNALNLGADAAVIIGDLAARTHAMAERAAALEANLADASDELSGLRDELEKAKLEGSSDALTSLPNRRAFDSRLLEAVAVAQAARQPLSLAFCDIDHFKTFNDRWGHRLGDQVLRYVGAQMASMFKDSGLPARFGGEEFVVLLPKHGTADAVRAITLFCDIIRSRVLRVRTDGREIGHLTFSVGVTTLRRGDDANTFLERADAAMYEAKNAGRDRVVVVS